MFENIKSKYILSFILSYLEEKRVLKIIAYNKLIQNILEIDIDSFENIDIIMPFRKFTQVEISESDNEILWINAVETKSWELKKAEPITLIWPKWTIYLNNCVIIAEKHIHMSVADAKDFGFRNNQIVNLKMPWKDWKIIEKVRIRTNDKFEFDSHLNEDEWKRYWIWTNDWAEILK